jgi:hypothetical protein
LSRHAAYNKGEWDNEDVIFLKEYHFRVMTVDLETIGEEYQQQICQGMKKGLEDHLVAAELAKKIKGRRKLPDRVVVVKECIYVPRTNNSGRRSFRNITIAEWLDTQGDMRHRS